MYKPSPEVAEKLRAVADFSALMPNVATASQFLGAIASVVDAVAQDAAPKWRMTTESPEPYQEIVVRRSLCDYDGLQLVYYRTMTYGVPVNDAFGNEDDAWIPIPVFVLAEALPSPPEATE